MNKNIYKTGFFALLILNIILIIIISFRPAPRPPQIKDRISKELRLSDEQSESFARMVQGHRSSMINLENEERTLVTTLFGMLSSETSVEVKDSLLQEISRVEANKVAVTYDHFEDLKDICEEDQKKRFDKVVSIIIPMITAPPGPAQGRRPR